MYGFNLGVVSLRQGDKYASVLEFLIHSFCAHINPQRHVALDEGVQAPALSAKQARTPPLLTALRLTKLEVGYLQAAGNFLL